MKNVTVTMEDAVADGARMEAAPRNANVFVDPNVLIDAIDDRDTVEQRIEPARIVDLVVSGPEVLEATA